MIVVAVVHHLADVIAAVGVEVAGPPMVVVVEVHPAAVAVVVVVVVVVIVVAVAVPPMVVLVAVRPAVVTVVAVAVPPMVVLGRVRARVAGANPRAAEGRHRDTGGPLTQTTSSPKPRPSVVRPRSVPRSVNAGQEAGTGSHRLRVAQRPSCSPRRVINRDRASSMMAKPGSMRARSIRCCGMPQWRPLIALPSVDPGSSQVPRPNWWLCSESETHVNSLLSYRPPLTPLIATDSRMRVG
jgi:hypothetical protein